MSNKNQKFRLNANFIIQDEVLKLWLILRECCYDVRLIIHVLYWY
jgi:hypothetical protein